MITESIIDRYLSSRLGDYDRRGKQIRFDCPHCDDGNKKNLEINIDKNMFNCWSCGYSGSMRKLMTDYSIDNTWRLLPEFKVNYEKIEVEEKIINYPQNTVPVHLNKNAFTYLTVERGLNPVDIKQRSISYVFDQSEIYYNHICYPFFDDGKLVGACLQNLDTKKYRNLTKLDFIPYREFINSNYPITLTEGNVDALSSINAIPMLGTKINKATKDFLIGKNVILAVDNTIDIVHFTDLVKELVYVKQLSIFDLKEYEDMNDYAVKDQNGFLDEYRKCYKEFE